MISFPQDEPIWVATAADLHRMLAELAAAPRLAVDTESNSLYVYQEQVCLIQFSTGQRDYLVDALALPDLSGLAPIFANPAIEKVFHAAEYDLLCMKRDYGFEFVNLFDTMLAARILGRQAVGLGSMLEEAFGIHLDKRFQRANWGIRPLPRQQLDYARMDSHFLIPLCDVLFAELQRSGRLDLAQEDFRRLCAVTPSAESNGDNCWRVAGGQELSPQQAGVLHELCRYRDQRARSANLPPFKILSNQVLVQVALDCPQNERDLQTQGMLSPRQYQLHAAGLLAAVRNGLASGPLYRTYNRRPDEQYINRLEALRNWRRQTGQALGVESDVILPRTVLETIAQHNPRCLDDLTQLMDDLPWRLQRFGSQILEVLNP